MKAKYEVMAVGKRDAFYDRKSKFIGKIATIPQQRKAFLKYHRFGWYSGYITIDKESRLFFRIRLKKLQEEL